MNKVIHKIILDMKSIISQQTIDIQRYDTGRKFAITLSDNGAVYPIKEGCLAVFMATKPDKTILYNHCDIVDNTIVFDLFKNPQLAAAEGEVRCEIRLYGADGTLITSPCFDIIVDKTLYTDNIIESSSEFSELTKAIVANLNAVEAANQAVRNAETSVGNFTGQALDQIEEFENDAEQEVDDAVSNAETKVNKAVAEAKNEINAAVADMRSIVNDSANAFKGYVSGAAVTIKDISPLEQPLKVKVSGDGIDPSTIKITRCGKNLFNKNDLIIGSWLNLNGEVEKEQGYNVSDFIPVLPNTAYHIGNRGSSRTKFYNANKTALTGAWDAGSSEAAFTTPYNCHYLRVTVTTVYQDSLQLEVGKVATEYEPFKGGESFTPNADGTVEGVKSIYPVMNLRTDTEGAIIEAEYNRDSNVVVKELYDYIKSIIKSNNLTDTKEL